jgi:hypothetical protein
MRAVVDRRGLDRQAASASQMTQVMLPGGLFQQILAAAAARAVRLDAGFRVRILGQTAITDQSAKLLVSFGG